MAQQLAAHPPAAGHNGIQVLRGVSQAEFLGWLNDLQGLDEEVAAAVDKRKAFLADVKQRLGKDEFASFKSVRKDAEMAGESRERRELARRQMMRWLNKPVGFQASMDMETEDPGIAALNEYELQAIQDEGFRSGERGFKRDSNPYTPGHELYALFDQAWLRGQASIAESMAPNAGGNGTETRRRGRPRKDQAEQVH